jgi:tetratricopeptide (TPR) repeat protein
MKALSAWFIFLLGCTPVTGWSTVPDSLKCRIDSLTALTRSSALEQKYAGEFGIAWELYDVDNPYATRYARMAYRSICAIGDSARLLKTGRLLGQLLRRVDKLDSAILILEGALPIAVALKDSIEQAKIYNALSVVYTFEGRYDMTLLNNLKSLEISQALKDTVGMVIAFGNTGVTYYKMENSLEAERYYLAAFNLRSFYRSNQLLTNMALVKINLGDTLAFYSLSERALVDITQEEMAGVCVAYSFGYGMHFLKVKKHRLALNHFHDALLGALQNEDFRMEAESKLKIGECYLSLGHYDEAMKVVSGLEARFTATRMNPLRLTYYDLMSNGLERQGRLRNALVYRRKHQMLFDTISGQTVMNKVLMARVKIEQEQNRITLSRQAEVISLKEQVIGRQQLLILLSVSLLTVLLVLGLVLTRFYRFQKQIARDLDKKVLERTRELEQSERELTSSLGQQQALMDMIAAKVHASLATLRGLWAIRFSEDGDPIENEFDKAAIDLLQVPQIIRRSTVSRTKFSPPNH